MYIDTKQVLVLYRNNMAIEKKKFLKNKEKLCYLMMEKRGKAYIHRLN